MTANFTNLINSETPEFQSLMYILGRYNVYAPNGRRLLCLVNHIIDFYLTREGDDVRMPLVFFPACEPWAQTLCEEFVALKFALQWGDYGLHRCRDEAKRDCIVLGTSAKRRDRQIKGEQLKFAKCVDKNVDESFHVYSAPDNSKCWIYSRYLQDKLAERNKYNFIKTLLGKKTSDPTSATILNAQDEEDVSRKTKAEKGKLTFPNIVLFPQISIDGRISKLCRQLHSRNIAKYNRRGMGIRNVFQFVFSAKPYRLYHTFDHKNRLAKEWQGVVPKDMRHFISFTYEEMNYLFGRGADPVEIYDVKVAADQNLEGFIEAFNDCMHDVEDPMLLHNSLASCIDKLGLCDIWQRIIDEIKPEISNDLLIQYFNTLNQALKTFGEEKLAQWAAGQQIALVLDDKINLTDELKRYYRVYLELISRAESVNFYKFKDFKERTIAEDKILVLTMRNHYTSGRYGGTYPNSFDPYILRPGQSVLQVNNYIALGPQLQWAQYYYDQQKYYLHLSDFQRQHGLMGTAPQRPQCECPSLIDEESSSSREGTRRATISVHLSGQQKPVSIDEKELVLCEENDQRFICTMARVQKDYDDPTTLKIQQLSELFGTLRVFVANKQRILTQGELMIRKLPQYELTPEEINSPRELWKILLQRRVAVEGKDAVYQSIMTPEASIDRLRFENGWLNNADTTIIPRNKRLQRQLMHYLGLDDTYLRILRRKRMSACRDTAQQNDILEAFLTRCLLSPEPDKAYSELGDDIIDYMGLSPEDIPTLLEMIEEQINLQQIQSIP